MAFDWNISIGTIIEIAGIAGGGGLFLIQMKSDVRDLYTRLTHIIADVANVKRENEKQSEKLDRILERDSGSRFPNAIPPRRRSSDG